MCPGSAGAHLLVGTPTIVGVPIAPTEHAAARAAGLAKGQGRDDPEQPLEE